MSKLYIIGAGCSKNYKQSISPVKGLEPPINRDFFKMAKKVIDHYQLSWMFGPIAGLDHFIRNINRLFGYGDSEVDTTSFLDDRLTLEEIMTHFYLKQELIDYTREFNSRTETLNDLLAYVLAESLSGGICQNHIKLAKSINYEDVILNFNYDILLDNALNFEGKLFDNGYGIDFNSVYIGNGWKNPDIFSTSVKMFKLHGSLNWLKCENCDSILLLENQKDVQALWTGIKELEISCPKCGANKGDGLNRYIIPPGIKDIKDIKMRYLWKKVSEINNIEEVISIGYSFSDSDPQIRMLLREMIARNGIIPQVPIKIITHNEESYEDIKSRVKNIWKESQILYEHSESFFNNL